MKYLCNDLGSEKNNGFELMKKNESNPSEKLKKLGSLNLDTVEESKGKVSESDDSFDNDIRSDEDDEDGIRHRDDTDSESETSS